MGEVRWGLMTIFGVTSLIIFSPLSFSPVGEMLVTPLLYFLCRFLRYCLSSATLLAIAVCPSPTGEVRWGLMTIFGVTSLIIFSPLSFSPVGEMMVTPLLYFLCGYSAIVAIASAASCRQTEKLGQSLKSMMAYEPSALTMQSPPYTSILVS